MSLFLCLATSTAKAGDEPKTYPLYPEGVPGAQGGETGDEFHSGDVPTFTVFRPEEGKANGASVVICPGGGYGFLATEHEGKEVALWLNSLGVTGVVLKYRLAPKYHHPAMLHDVQRAIRTVRERAQEWGLDPKRVAVHGFSAGGHLASTAATHFDAGDDKATDAVDRQGSRPDVAVLIYPVIMLSGPHAHGGSRDNLLGEDAPQEMIDLLSNEKRVTEKTPPTFLVHSTDDGPVPPENSVEFARSLRAHRVPHELHLFDHGGHGYGLGGDDPVLSAWPDQCAAWLRRRGFLAAP